MPGRRSYEEALVRVRGARAPALRQGAAADDGCFDEETGRFLAANDAAIQRYGFSREEFLQVTIYDIRPPRETAPSRSASCRGTRAARGAATDVPAPDARGRTDRGRHHLAMRSRLTAVRPDSSWPSTSPSASAPLRACATATRGCRKARRGSASSPSRFDSVFYLFDVASCDVALHQPWRTNACGSSSCESLREDWRLVHLHGCTRTIAELVAASDATALREGVDSEYRLLMPDGRVKWITRPRVSGAGRRRAGLSAWPASPPKSPRRSGWRPSWCRRRRWRASAGWPAASPTTSTTC